MIFECVQRFTLRLSEIRVRKIEGRYGTEQPIPRDWWEGRYAYTVRVPYPYRSIARSGVQSALTANAATSPPNDVHAGRMPSERVLQPPSGARPNTNAAVLGRRSESRRGGVPRETEKRFGQSVETGGFSEEVGLGVGNQTLRQKWMMGAHGNEGTARGAFTTRS